VTTTADWLNEAFFDDPEVGSLDGGTTNVGDLWHAISPRWGHSMHSMCSYHGMFPPRLAHYFIHSYSQPGGLVADPFSGRGTTTLQARVEGRRTISNDLSPLGYVLSKAKADPPTWPEMTAFISRLETRFNRSRASEPDVSDDIRMLFHPNTLRQLVFLRNGLLGVPMDKWSRPQLMLAGTIAGILHGAHRSNGSSMYLSISMPNTFSMPPTYVKKFIRDNGLVQLDQNVFDRLRDKLARIYVDSSDGVAGQTFKSDACALLSGKSLQPSSVDLVVTSPPYLKVVNYGTSNWIRLWWLGIDDVSRHGGAGRHSLDAQLDHRHTYDSYRDFMLRTLKGVQRVLKQNGVAVFVIGDVATPGRPSMELASQIWADIGEQTNLRLVEFIKDSLPSHSKVSRIWGDTKGQATDHDCVLVLARKDGDPVVNSREIEWDEPYKDGGPDAAHAHSLRQRLAC
jgi:DNA modification methylase